MDQKLPNLNDQQATSLLRHGYIERQNQSGTTIKDDQVSDILAGKQDQSIGFDDAVYAMTNAGALWDKSQQGSFAGSGS